MSDAPVHENEDGARTDAPVGKMVQMHYALLMTTNRDGYVCLSEPARCSTHGSIEESDQLGVLSGDLCIDPVICPSVRDVVNAVVGGGDDGAVEAIGEDTGAAGTDGKPHPLDGILSALGSLATLLCCAQLLVGYSKLMSGIEKLGGGGVGVVRLDEDESVCCQDESWGDQGRTLVLE